MLFWMQNAVTEVFPVVGEISRCCPFPIGQDDSIAIFRVQSTVKGKFIKRNPALLKSQQTAVQSSETGQNMSERWKWAFLLMREKRVVLSRMNERKMFAANNIRPKDVACNSWICLTNRQYRQQLVASSTAGCASRGAIRRCCQLKRRPRLYFPRAGTFCILFSHEKYETERLENKYKPTVQG